MQGTSATVSTEFVMSLGNIIITFQFHFFLWIVLLLPLSLLFKRSFVCVFSHLLKAEQYSVYPIPWENTEWQLAVGFGNKCCILKFHFPANASIKAISGKGEPIFLFS